MLSLSIWRANLLNEAHPHRITAKTCYRAAHGAIRPARLLHSLMARLHALETSGKTSRAPWARLRGALRTMPGAGPLQGIILCQGYSCLSRLTRFGPFGSAHSVRLLGSAHRSVPLGSAPSVPLRLNGPGRFGPACWDDTLISGLGRQGRIQFAGQAEDCPPGYENQTSGGVGTTTHSRRTTPSVFMGGRDMDLERSLASHSWPMTRSKSCLSDPKAPAVIAVGAAPLQPGRGRIIWTCAYRGRAAAGPGGGRGPRPGGLRPCRAEAPAGNGAGAGRRRRAAGLRGLCRDGEAAWRIVRHGPSTPEREGIARSPPVRKAVVAKA